MKRRFNIKPFQLIALIVVLFTSFSCKDKTFEEQNAETITPDQHYKSLIDASVSLRGAFVPLQNVMPKLIVLDGLRSDQMTVTASADPYLVDINNQVLNFNNPYLDASDYYKVIVNCNEAIANFYKIGKNDRNFDEFYLKYTKGALIGLKSWTYLNLIKLYGKAALIEDNMVTLPKDLNQTILEKNAMIDLLIDSLLPYIPSTADLANKVELQVGGYMNTKAVLGELYLEKGDYVNAVKYLKLAMESFGNDPTFYKLSGDANEGWRNIFTGGSFENISLVYYSQSQQQFNPLARWLLPTDQFMVKPTTLLVDSFLTQVTSKDIRGDAYRGLGGLTSGPATIDTTSTGEFFINKYSITKDEPFSAPIIISRVADLHLLLAEALNRNGDSKTALVLMNQGFKNEKPVPPQYTKWSKNLGVRGRVYLKSRLVPDSVYELPITADSVKIPLVGDARMLYVEDLIMDERSLELAFEGKRWFDLVRVATRRNDPAYLADKVAAKFPESQREAIRTKLMIPSNWYLPFTKAVAQ